jgi:hypothetical protein
MAWSLPLGQCEIHIAHKKTGALPVFSFAKCKKILQNPLHFGEKCDIIKCRSVGMLRTA